MNASARKAKQILRDRSANTRLQASLRRGRSLTTHLIAAGADAETAKGVANGLRQVAKRLHVEPVKTARTHRTVDGTQNRSRPVGHYTAAQVALIAANYRPRKAEYRIAAAQLRLAA